MICPKTKQIFYPKSCPKSPHTEGNVFNMSDTNEAEELQQPEAEITGDWNEDIEGDIEPKYSSSLVLYSRDWTVATILDQIAQKNIDLNPAFQRRNAWDDKRRSRLIESLILGVPVPEIMLAEDMERRRAYLVLDGKQRLLSIAGFVHPELNPFWNKAQLRQLSELKDLNGMTYIDLKKDVNLERVLLNAIVRCSIISNYETTDVLYDIFYRLNTGSVPLSTQELRQVLHPGACAEYLVQTTANPGQPIHRILGRVTADGRLRDVELVLRFISFVMFGSEYNGNLKNFLDNSLKKLNKHWDQQEAIVRMVYEKYNASLNLLIEVFKDYRRVGRKFTDGKWESRFNKVLLEVEAFYFMSLIDTEIDETQRTQFIHGFRDLCSEPTFRASIESTTKTNSQYVVRFKLFGQLMNEVFGIDATNMPVHV